MKNYKSHNQDVTGWHVTLHYSKSNSPRPKKKKTIVTQKVLPYACWYHSIIWCSSTQRKLNHKTNLKVMREENDRYEITNNINISSTINARLEGPKRINEPQILNKYTIFSIWWRNEPPSVSSRMFLMTQK